MNRYIDVLMHEFPNDVIDITGGDGKFIAYVTSVRFEGLKKLARHKLVYKALNEFISSGEIHALSIVAKTPAEV